MLICPKHVIEKWLLLHCVLCLLHRVGVERAISARDLGSMLTEVKILFVLFFYFINEYTLLTIGAHALAKKLNIRVVYRQ